MPPDAPAPTAPTDSGSPGAPPTSPSPADPGTQNGGAPGIRTLPPEAGALRLGREADRSQKAIEALQAKKRAADPDPPAESAAEPAKAPEAANKPPAEAKPAPEPQKTDEKLPEPDAKLRSQIERLQQGALESEKKFREAETQLKEAREAAERAKKLRDNPLDLLKDAGYSLEDLVRKAAKGELRATTENDLALERQDSKTSALEAELKQLRERIESKETQERTERELQAAKARVQEREEALPVSSTLDWAAEWARNEWSARRERGEDVSFDAVSDELEKAVMGDFRSLALNDRALRSLLADSEVKASVLKALGPQAPQQTKTPTPASSERGSSASDGPSAIPRDVATQPGTRTTGGMPTADERMAAARDALRRRRSA